MGGQPLLVGIFRTLVRRGNSSRTPGASAAYEAIMEQNRDEQIVCNTCGAAFVFSAAEASFYAERGLMVPRRCRPCRADRKSRGGDRRGRTSTPQYTGDV